MGAIDHDAKYGLEVPASIRSKIVAAQTAIRRPWQNGIAERWVGSCRRDLLDHVIALNEHHLNCFVLVFRNTSIVAGDPHQTNGANRFNPLRRLRLRSHISSRWG